MLCYTFHSQLGIKKQVKHYGASRIKNVRQLDFLPSSVRVVVVLLLANVANVEPCQPVAEDVQLHQHLEAVE